MRRLGENLSQKLGLEFCRPSKVNSWNVPVESDDHLVGRQEAEPQDCLVKLLEVESKRLKKEVLEG